MVARVHPATGAISVTHGLREGRRVAVLVNGNARDVTPKVVAQARDVVPAGDLYVSDDLAAARVIARTLIDRGYEAVLAGGGDGTFVRCVSDLHAAAAQR